MVVFENILLHDITLLKKQGYKEIPICSLYEDIRLQKDKVILILYKSGKLLLQGPITDVKHITNELSRHLPIHKHKEIKFQTESGWIIGSDESLKGDTFGGITVAAVKADDTIRKQLRELGVADSKTLDDHEIIPLAQKIKRIAPCEIIDLLPEEYNKSFGITVLLNKLHSQCAHYLKPGTHIVDKYPGCTAGSIQIEKAESKYVEVAAASILARATALSQLNYLSTLAGFPLPKGSTHVRDALQELKKRNLDFNKFTKMDFRNVKEFLKK
jgi:ribonuclease HIII